MLLCGVSATLGSFAGVMDGHGMHIKISARLRPRASAGLVGRLVGRFVG